MLNTLDLPVQTIKPKLTIEHVAALLQKNYTQAQIAKHLHVTRQAVNQYISTHYDILHPLIDNTDAVLAMRLKKEAIEITQAIDPADRKKASLQQKITSAAICIEKYRLLTDKSTSNISYQDISRDLDAINAELAKYNISDDHPQNVVFDTNHNDNDDQIFNNINKLED